MGFFGDKIAIVTGGGSGIGRAVCEALGSAGAAVVAADIDGEGAERTAATITGAGGRARAVQLDVSRAGEVQRLVDDTVAQHGRLDYIFNNAGIGIAGDVRDMTLEQWDRIIDVNVRGVIYGTMAAYAHMARQGSGHIVNTASSAGLAPAPMMTAYSTTKHAVVGLSASLRVEAADLGIRVSVVCPGYVNTPIFETSPILNADRKHVVDSIPFKMIDPAEAGRAILRGVRRNDAFIVFPLHAQALWRMHRLSPGSLNPLLIRKVREFRALRPQP